MRSTRSSWRRKPTARARSRNCWCRWSRRSRRCARRTPMLSADAGYHSEDNLEALEARKLEAFIADNGYRKRDPRYAGQEKHKASPMRCGTRAQSRAKPSYIVQAISTSAEDHSHASVRRASGCTATGRTATIGGRRAMKFTGAKRDCENCALRAQCLRAPQRSIVRQVAFFMGKLPEAKDSATERMKVKIDSAQGQAMIARRFATVEPVFGNLRAQQATEPIHAARPSARSTGSGSSTAWCTTSRSSRTTATRHENGTAKAARGRPARAASPTRADRSSPPAARRAIGQP